MQTYNDIASAIFDFLLAPFGHRFPVFDLLLWPVIMGIVALVVYKHVSNQTAIARVKKQISMHLLEIRLFSHDIVQVLESTATILWKNTLYIAHNLTPMVVLLIPMVAVMVQLVAHYAYEPARPGSTNLLHLQLDPQATDLTGLTRDVSLELPAGVKLEAPPVRTADGQVFWRLRAQEAGDHVVQVQVGGDTFEKGWAVGGDARKVPAKRLRSWEALLYPGEPAIPADAPILSIELQTDTRPLTFFPEGEFGILMWAMVLSLAAGVALKGVFGVTL
jgi:hypothetical protein